MRILTPEASSVEAQPRSKSKLVEAAHEFEAQVMKELLVPITEHDGDGDDSNAGNPLGEFAGEALGRSLSSAGGLGIADRIIASLSRFEKASSRNPPDGNEMHDLKRQFKSASRLPIR